MKRWPLAVLALCASVAFADEPKPSAYAEACCREIDSAGAAGAWHWSHGAWIADAADFKAELRKVLAEKFPDECAAVPPCADGSPDAKRDEIWALFLKAMRTTASWRRIADCAAAHGFSSQIGLAFEQQASGATVVAGGRTADVTLALRASLRKFRTGTNVTEIAYDEWCGANAPSLHLRGYDEDGRGKMCCRYEKWPEAECAWQAKTRELGKARTFAAFDCAASWQLLARNPDEYAHEDVLKALGKPTRSSRLQCRNCGKADLRWTYEMSDADADGKALRHTLVFAFADDGRCVRWEWSAE